MKVKDLKKLLDGFGDEIDELEVYLQERIPSLPYYPMYITCNMTDFNIGIQKNGRTVYFAIGDVVHRGDVGFAWADNSEIKWQPIH